MASQISRGVKLIVKQHGVNYGQISKWDNEKHEINICNKYLTYGWNYNNKKTFSSCNFYSFKTKNYKNLEKKNILIVPDDVRFFKTNNIIFDNNILNILKVYDGFLKKFKKNELNNIYFKSHPLSIKSNFYLENYLKKKYKINYLDYNINLNNIFDNFKLIIFFYNSTEFLNLIDNNKPAIFINNKFFYKTLSKSAIPMFNILKKNNIYFDNIANAHKLLGRKDLNKWWDSKKISKVRAVFKDQFSNSNEKNYLSTIKYLKKIKIN